ncbi:MAG: hypothetical protein KF861_09525, partial [Planctomycetaceae bacterium]|nr:hypothetical protein [Planctomycetaceae bacterium]
QRIADSKFNDDVGFGENRFGKLMLTDHGSEVWYRNFDLTELPTSSPVPERSTIASQAGCPTAACCAWQQHACENGCCGTSYERPLRRARRFAR